MDSSMPQSRTPTQFPIIEEITPGLWVLPLPLSDISLGYVLAYVLEGDNSLFLVDTGWDTPDTREALTDGLSQIGAGLTSVEGVVSTHLHADHFGLAGFVRQASGAWVTLHPADAHSIPDNYDRELLHSRLSRWLEVVGVPTSRTVEILDAASLMSDRGHVIEPDFLVDHEDGLPIRRWDIRAIHTPGHTPGHICLWLESADVLLTGDHLLPRITPNVPLVDDSSRDPLGDFRDSLRRVADIDPTLALPAHEWRFTNVKDRVADLLAHHHDRLDEAYDAVLSGQSTVWEVATVLTWSRGWESLGGNPLRSALGETFAHLALLERHERIRRVFGSPGFPIEWQANPPPRA